MLGPKMNDVANTTFARRAAREAKKQTKLLEQIAARQATAPPPGWYTDENGVRRWWSGTVWAPER